jgi:hypothetical protein
MIPPPADADRSGGAESPPVPAPPSRLGAQRATHSDRARRRRFDLTVASVLVVIVLLVGIYGLDPGVFHPGGSPAVPSPQLLLPQGTWQNLTGGNPHAFTYFTIQEPGQLRGSFLASGGQVTIYVCSAEACGPFVGHPNGSVFVSAPLSQGNLSLALSSAGPYAIQPWPTAPSGQPGSGCQNSTSPGDVCTITWTSPVEVTFG